MESSAAEMEEIAEAKQRSLGAAFESLNSQASSIIQFTVEWKELEDHFESSRAALNSRFNELDDRLKEAAEAERRRREAEDGSVRVTAEMERLTAEAERRRKEVEDREGYLESVRALIEENDEELRVREERYGEMERLIREKEREVEEVERRVKEKRRKLNWVEKRIEVKGREVGEEENRLSGVKGLVEERRRELIMVSKELEGKVEMVRFVEESIAECCRELEVKEGVIRVADRKGEEFCLLKRTMQEWWCKVERKEREMEGLVARLESREKEVEMKVEELGLIRKEVETKEMHLDSLEKLLRGWEEELHSVQKLVEVKEREMEGLVARLELKEREVELKVKEIGLMRKEFLDEVELKEKRLHLLEKLLLEREEELHSVQKSVEMKEREMEGLVAKLELKEREVELKVEEIGLMRKAFLDEVELKEKHLHSLEKLLLEREGELHSMQKLVEGCSRGSVMTKDGRGLHLFMDEHLKRIDSMGTDLSAILMECSDPGKLVLDAMQGFYPENRESGFELRVRRRSCCLLLEELMRMSPQMNPQVKEEAAKLAADWKSKMTVASDNDLEVLGFLRLVAAYGLTSTYDAKELKRLLSNVSHGQQAAEIGPALGIKAPGSHMSTPVKIEEPESSAPINAATVSSPNRQSNATRDARNSQEPGSSAANNTAPVSSPNPQSSGNTDARNFQGSINEHLSWNLNAIQNELVASVQRAADPGKLVLMLMQNFLVKYWTTEEASLKKGVMSCNISLLKMLMRVSPQVSSQVKEDAKKLGLEWKAKIRAAEHLENRLEIVGFLLFVVAYGLLSTLNGDEIVKFLERLSQHKEAVESLQMHGFLDRILAVFIQTLVERKQLFQAIGFVFKFNLLGQFTPVQVLTDYVKDVNLSETLKGKNSIDEKVEFIDSRIADLKAVFQCIKEYNLEFGYPYGEIHMQIVELEKIKEICRGSEKCGASVTRQQEQSQGKKRSSSSSPVVQQGQQKSKFHRTAEASPSPYKSPSFTPVQLQSRLSRSPSCLAYGYNGQPGQIGNMAANSVQIDRTSSLASGIYRQHGQFGYMAANLPEVDPRFGIIDEVDPLFGVPNLLNPHPLMDFTPFPGSYGPY